MLSILAILATGYVIVVGALWALQRQLLYLPDRSSPSASAAGVPEMADVRLHTADGLDLLAWWRPPGTGQATVLYLHGNGGHIGYRGARVRPLLDRGMGVLLVGYRGYGGNPGSPSEAGLLADGRAALDFLAAQGVPAERTVMYGESLGSTVAVILAAEMAALGRPVAALVLEAPLSSVADVAARHYPWVPVGWLLKDRFEAAAHIAAVTAPVLLIHGDDDAIVPIRFARKLYDAAVQPKQAAWIAGAGHDDLPAWGSREIVIAFLERWLTD